MSSTIGKERPFVEDTKSEEGNRIRNAGYGIEIASIVKPRHRLISIYHGTNLIRSLSLPDVRQSSQIMISSFRDTVMDHEDATKSAEMMKILMTFCIIGCIVKFLVVLFFCDPRRILLARILLAWRVVINTETNQ